MTWVSRMLIGVHIREKGADNTHVRIGMNSQKKPQLHITSEDTLILYLPLCDVFLLAILRSLHHVLRPYTRMIIHYWTGKLVSRIYLKRFTY